MSAFRNVNGQDAVKACVKAGGIQAKGIMVISKPNGQIITIPVLKDLKIGLLKASIKNAGLAEEEFNQLL